jgi:hypothetical protein
MGLLFWAPVKEIYHRALVAVVKPNSNSLPKLVKGSPLQLSLFVTARLGIVLIEVPPLVLCVIQPESPQVLLCRPRSDE